MNCNGQCIRCNQHLHGNLIFYRIGLVIKYGEEAVRELELKATMFRTKKWSRQELEEIIETYK